jgi:protein TonB
VRSRTVIASALIHAAVFGLALRISSGRAQRRATTVAVVGEKKKPEPKKEPPKPRPLLASARPAAVRPAAAPKAAPAPEAPTPQAAAPSVDTGLELSNDDGPGIALGGPEPAARAAAASTAAAAPEKRAAPVKKEKVLAPRADSPEDDNCTEAPSKPVPLQRPSEIEYTQEARAAGVEGRLVLKITVGADGAVREVEVVSAVDPQLDAAAIAAVKTWVFKPSLRCGKPMGGGTFTLARRFELGD